MMEDFTVIQRRRAHERAEIREALTMSAARASIDRLLGEEVIAAAREVVRLRNTRQSAVLLNRAIDRLEELVGTP